jgi:toxin ParE1/3/4
VRQAREYAKVITATLTELAANPFLIGSTERRDIGTNLWSGHIARDGRKGRHFVIYRIPKSKNQKIVDVLRVLHDSMDIVQPRGPSEKMPVKELGLGCLNANVGALATVALANFDAQVRFENRASRGNPSSALALLDMLDRADK